MTYSSTLLRRLTRLAILAAVLSFFISLESQVGRRPASHPLLRCLAAQRSRDEDTWEAQQRRELAKKENIKRQQDLKKDTDKLLELATELKQYVDKTNENMLSVEVIKKAEEIEKLAHSVKDKMRRD